MNLLRILLSLAGAIATGVFFFMLHSKGDIFASLHTCYQPYGCYPENSTLFIFFAVGFIVSYPILYYWALKKIPTFTKLLSSTVSYSKEISEGMKVDPEYYAVAEQEILDNDVDKGLWAKAFVNAKGNETVRKAEYIKLRAKQLQKES